MCRKKVQAEPSYQRLHREGDGKTASQYAVSVAKKFDKGELLLVSWMQHIIVGQVGTSKHNILQREGLQLKGGNIKIEEEIVFEAFGGQAEDERV